LEDLVAEEVIHGIGDLLNIEVDVAFKIFVSDWMQYFIPSSALFRKNSDEDV